MTKPVFSSEEERKAWVLKTIGERCVGWQDIARYLGVSRVSVWRYWRDDPRFPRGVSLGRKGSQRRWHITEVDEWLETRCNEEKHSPS